MLVSFYRYLFVFLFALPLTKLWADLCQNAATGRLETRAQSNKRFLPFNEAMLKARQAGISSKREYNRWQKGQSDMPSNPDQFYPKWKSWGDFLGTGNVKGRRRGNFLPFEEAMLKAQAAGVSSRAEYKEWQKGQSDMPSNPHRIYEGEWQGWGHFLGTGNIRGRKEDFLSFEEAMLKAQSAGVSSLKEYNKWQKGHSDMPSAPNQVYAKEWQGWGHFLGTENIRGRKEDFLSFEEAMLKAQSAGVSSLAEYNEWQRGQSDMPSRPEQVYAKEWRGWGHFLGTGNIKGGGRIITGNVKDRRKGNFLPFEEARLKAQSAGVSSLKKYNEWQKGHSDMPSAPNQVYPDQWQGWGHFLKTGRFRSRISFKKAMLKAQAAGLSSREEYHEWQKEHSDMPSAPNQVYAKEWPGWRRFLGTGNVKGGGRIITRNVRDRRRRNFLPFEEARLKAQAAGVSSRAEYSEWQKGHSDMPSNPPRIYEGQWHGWGHFLGTGNVRGRRRGNFLPFEEALLKAREGSIQLSLSDQKNFVENFEGLEGYLPWADRHFEGDMEKAFLSAKALLLSDVFDQLNWDIFYGSTQLFEDFRNLPLFERGKVHENLKGLKGYVLFSLRITHGNMKTAYMNLKAVLNEDLMSQLEWPYFDGSVRELISLENYILKKGRDHFIKEFKGAKGFSAFVEQYHWIKKQKGGIVAQQRSYRGQEGRALNHVSVALGPYYERLEWERVSIQNSLPAEPDNVREVSFKAETQ